MIRIVLTALTVCLFSTFVLQAHSKASSLGSVDKQHSNYEILREEISSLRGLLLLFDCDRQYPLINARMYLKNASSILENSFLETSVVIASLYYSVAQKSYDQAVGYYRIVLEICTPK